MQFFTFLSLKRKELHVFYGGIGVEASKAPASRSMRRPQGPAGCFMWRAPPRASVGCLLRRALVARDAEGGFAARAVPPAYAARWRGAVRWRRARPRSALHSNSAPPPRPTRTRPPALGTTSWSRGNLCHSPMPVCGRLLRMYTLPPIADFEHPQVVASRL